MDAFPALRNPPQDDNGDAMLDALLGMDMPFEAETVNLGESSRRERPNGFRLIFTIVLHVVLVGVLMVYGCTVYGANIETERFVCDLMNVAFVLG